MKSRTPAIFVASLLLVVFFFVLARQTAADLYVSDSEANAVYRYTTDGVQHIFASIYQPYCIAFDPANNLYVSSYGKDTIYKIRPNGQKSIFKSGNSVVNPVAIAFDSIGNFFISHGTIDPGVEKFNRGGTITHYLRNYEFGGIALDSVDYLYATDILNSRILKIAPNGSYKTVAPGFAYPGRLTFDSADNLYAPSYYEDLIYKITPSGSETQFASVAYPEALVMDQSDYLFVASSYNGEGSIFEVAPDGTLSIFATGLKNPVDLAVPNSP